MVRWSLLAVASLLLGTVLAGCAGKAADDAAADGSTFLAAAPTAAGRGAISGVVVDEAIRPIAGANVTLGGQLATVRTDANGRFAFDDVAPGFMTLQAKATGYFAIHAPADVKAGETAKVRIQLLADRSPVPYHTTLKFKGFMQLWGGIGQFVVDLAYTSFVDPNGTALCQCYFYFTPDSNLTGLVYEAVWTEATPRPTGAEDKAYYYGVEQDTSNMIETDYCTSPCRSDISLADYKPVLTRAFLQGPDLYVSVNQDFELYISLFYRAPQPKGWSFVNGDA